MIRTLLLFVAAAAAVWLAVWFADQPGRVDIEMLGYAIHTEKVGLLIVVLVILAAVAAVLYRLWRALRRAPRSIAEYRGASRRQRGYQALTQGMVAVAAGDPREARRSARRADALLNEPPLTMLLSAQAAQLEGDEDAARRYFECMLDVPEMAFLGTRGLLMQALRRGDKREALRLADKAHSIRPNTPWVLRNLLELQVGAGQWDAADQTLREAMQAGIIESAEGLRRRAVVAVEASRAASAAGDNETALKRARRAHDMDSDLVPASVAFARCLAEKGRARRATKAVEEAWRKAPHPELAAAYGVLGGTDESPLDRVRRFQRLAGLRNDHPESHLALAEASLAAELWGEARKHLEQAGAVRRSARFLRLMADLEERENGDLKAARRWLDEAATAAPEYAWYCGDCGSVAGEWHACCSNCGAFATLEWRLPPGLPATAAVPVLAPDEPAPPEKTPD